MRKFVICNVPMKSNVDRVVYESDDLSLPVSERAVRYPVSAFLEKTLSSGDELKVLMLVKKDEYSHYEKNSQFFIDELNEINKNIGAEIEFKVIDTEFEQSQAVHEQLMLKIVEEFEKEYNALVYFGIRSYTAFGKLDSFLYVSDHEDEWEYDNADLKDGYVVAYVYNYDDHWCSELGGIAVKEKFGGLVRIG